MRPELTKKLTPKEFNDYYFLKEELKEFCRNEGLKVSGSKEDLEKFVDIYTDAFKNTLLIGQTCIPWLVAHSNE